MPSLRMPFMTSPRLFRAAALVLGGVLVLCPIGVQAAVVVYGNLGNSGTNALSGSTNAFVSDTQWLAQAFTVGGTNTILQTVSAGLYDTEATTATLRLFPNVSGVPGGSAIATQTQVVNQTTASLFVFNFNAQLVSGSTYWAVLSSADGAETGFNWAFNNAGNAPSTRNTSGWTFPDDGETLIGTKLTTNSGATWGDSGVNRPASISITATAVPEPSTYAMAAAAAGLYGLAKLRRRRT